jgi:hypothetical protein
VALIDRREPHDAQPTRYVRPADASAKLPIRSKPSPKLPLPRTTALPTKDDMINPDVPIRYDAPSALRKWPSIKGEWVSPADGAAPYMIFVGTLDECIREFSAKPISQHHLYDVATGDQPAFEQNILSAPDVTKIIARADFPKLRRLIGDAAVK